MTVPKKALELVKQRDAGIKTGYCNSELRRIILNTDSDWADIHITDISVVDEPCGSLQNDDEYVDQVTGYLGDDFSGTYYYSIKDTDKYLAIQYYC